MTVEQVLEMSAAEFSGWMAYFKIKREKLRNHD